MTNLIRLPTLERLEGNLCVFNRFEVCDSMRVKVIDLKLNHRMNLIILTLPFHDVAVQKYLL